MFFKRLHPRKRVQRTVKREREKKNVKKRPFIAAGGNHESLLPYKDGFPRHHGNTAGSDCHCSLERSFFLVTAYGVLASFVLRTT